MEMPDAYLKNRDVIWNSQSNLFWQSHTFADLNPKVPGLILYFLCFCHSKSFLVSWFLQFPVIQEPADSPHVFQDLWFSCVFPDVSILSLLFTDCKKSTCRTDLSNIMPQSKEPYRDPMGGDALPLHFSEFYMLQLYHLCIHCRFQHPNPDKENKRYEGIVSWHVNLTLLPKQDCWLLINISR